MRDSPWYFRRMSVTVATDLDYVCSPQHAQVIYSQALTGFRVVSWVLYVPAVFFSFAAITGICPGLILARLMFPEKTLPRDSSGLPKG